MSSIEPHERTSSPQPRHRLKRAGRLRQLLDVAWQIVRIDGTDALTLGHLAETAGVSKPVVYSHFATRSELLAVLYQDFDRRQTAVMDAALQASEATLDSKASVIASSYVECVIRQGREIPGVIAALAGSPELEKIKRDYEATFLKKCWGVLAPFAGTPTLAPAGMWAMLGAAERLSYAAAAGDITQEQAQAELFETIVAMMSRTGRPGGPD